MEIAMLDRRLTLQLLNEMAMPVEAGAKVAHPPAGEGGTGLHHFPQRQAAPGEIGRQAGTAVEGGEWTGDAAGVALNATLKKILQYRLTLRATTTLTARTGICRQTQV